MDDPADFATRMREALVTSGLTLSRIREQLDARDLAVSMATLSYWSSGRSTPTRGRSVAVVEALEQILQTPSGWLTTSLPSTAREHGIDRVFGREDFLREAVEEHDLATSVWWRHHTVHHIVTIGADRRERGFETRILQTAARNGAQRWTILLEGSGNARVRPTGMSHLVRRVPLAEDLVAYEFGLDVALERGQRVLVAHSLDHACSQTSEGAGYGLKRMVDRLAMEVHFEGELPREICYGLRAPGSEEAVEQPTHPVLSGHVAQFVIDEAAAGMHQFSWEW